MSIYSINDLEQLSGIKAHTIRIWEKRYGILSPERTDTNIRTYGDNDLKLILNIATLNKSGIKISKIANMTSSEIGDMVLSYSSKQKNEDLIITDLTISMIELNEESFNQSLSKAIINNGFENAILNIVYPFFEKIGILWQTGNINPAHEHFVSNIVRQKLLVATDNLPLRFSRKSSFILFLPQNEMHEIALLFINFMIRNLGFRTFYLGQNVPTADLSSIQQSVNFTHLLTYITDSQQPEHYTEYLEKLSEIMKDKEIVLTGPNKPTSSKQLSNVTSLNDLDDLKKHLTTLS